MLYGDNGEVVGVATGDMGVGRDGKPKDSFTRGMELRGKYVLLAEGARGSLDQAADRQLQARRRPRAAEIRHRPEGALAGRRREASRPASCSIRFGWPLGRGASGGSFLYHYDDRLVVGRLRRPPQLPEPDLSPFDEFQRFKTHPLIRETFAGGKRLAYGARAITEGGWQSVPQLAFPGGALIGCAAGFVNVAAHQGLAQRDPVGHAGGRGGRRGARAPGRANDELTAYEDGWRDSDIGTRPEEGAQRQAAVVASSACVGVPLGGLDMWTNELFGASLFGTLKHGKPDSATLKPLAEVKPIVYPKPDGKLTFDKPSSVFLSNTNHEEDQPVHLRLSDPDHPDPRQSAEIRRAGAALLPGRRLRGGLRRRGQAHAIRASSSTRRTASTAKPATSRIPRRTSPGCRRRAAAGPNYPDM